MQMASSLTLCIFFLLLCFHLTTLTNSFTTEQQTLCHEEESSALLEFKQSFSMWKLASSSPSAYPKVLSWGKTRDCCSWDGVECDDESGHVIGLDLSSSLLYGSINSTSSLFRLVHLRSLNLADNHFNYSEILIKIHHLSELRNLILSKSYFSGPIPPSLANLTQLALLDLSYNYFSGEVPSLGALSELTQLFLSNNKLHMNTLTWLGMLPKLTTLKLRSCGLYGRIPSSIENLTQLTILDLNFNQLCGEIPHWLLNKTRMQLLDLNGNQLQGPLLASFFKLKNLEVLDLCNNIFTGQVNLQNFSELKNLFWLGLSRNKFSLVVNSNTNSSLPKFNSLDLSSCNLRKFPEFLRFQDELEVLHLESNKIKGMMPEWIWNMSRETLIGLCLSDNSITGFVNMPTVLPWPQLLNLYLDFNKLEGSLPIPPNSTIVYYANNNRLTGEIPSSICNLSSLTLLDLSDNNLTKIIPPCLGNLSNSISVLNLSGNNFHGIPQFFINDGSELRLLDLSRNQIGGDVPRSLANCNMLEILDLGNNQINDTFPSWLGVLTELQILVLKINKFYGVIERSSRAGTDFPKIHIIDLSNNRFTGNLPIQYFSNWKGMKVRKVDKMAYMKAPITFRATHFFWNTYSITIVNKGNDMLFPKVSNIFIAIDLSRNKFSGEISKSIGELVGLQMLNLSSNNLVGTIPSSLGNLEHLESLDLSQNSLSGKIPQELVSLNFLAVLNLSYNNLTGPIPQGKQFNTFENSSYTGNLGLCGDTLSNKCGNSEATTPPMSSEQEDNDPKFVDKFDWIVIIMGCAGGFVVGIVTGNLSYSKCREWFEDTFGKRGPIHNRRLRGN